VDSAVEDDGLSEVLSEQSCAVDSAVEDDGLSEVLSEQSCAVDSAVEDDGLSEVLSEQSCAVDSAVEDDGLSEVLSKQSREADSAFLPLSQFNPKRNFTEQAQIARNKLILEAVDTPEARAFKEREQALQRARLLSEEESLKRTIIPRKSKRVADQAIERNLDLDQELQQEAKIEKLRRVQKQLQTDLQNPLPTEVKRVGKKRDRYGFSGGEYSKTMLATVCMAFEHMWSPKTVSTIVHDICALTARGCDTTTLLHVVATLFDTNIVYVKKRGSVDDKHTGKHSIKCGKHSTKCGKHSIKCRKHSIKCYGGSAETCVILARHKKTFWLMGEHRQGTYRLVAADATDRDDFSFLFAGEEIQHALDQMGFVRPEEPCTVLHTTFLDAAAIEPYKQKLVDALLYKKDDDDHDDYDNGTIQ
jgi:hypothetical protein